MADGPAGGTASLPCAHVQYGPELLGKHAFLTLLRGEELGVKCKGCILETFMSTPLTESGGEGSISCGPCRLLIPSSQSFQIRWAGIWLLSVWQLTFPNCPRHMDVCSLSELDLSWSNSQGGTRHINQKPGLSVLSQKQPHSCQMNEDLLQPSPSPPHMVQGLVKGWWTGEDMEQVMKLGVATLKVVSRVSSTHRKGRIWGPRQRSRSEKRYHPEATT